MKNKLDINLVDEKCVDITLSETFRLGLDERGVPRFPQALNETLPPYVPETVDQRIKTKRQNPNQGPIYTAVKHAPWCPETSGRGRCNCNPYVPYVDIKKYSGISGEKLTCNVCEAKRSDVVEDDGCGRDGFLIEGGDMFYWLVGVTGTESELIICHLCMIDLGVKIYECN